MSVDKTPITIWAPEDVLWQTSRDRLRELIRVSAIDFLRNHPRLAMGRPWRDKPYMDGVRVDLEEDDVLDWMTDFIIAAADPDTDGRRSV